MPFWGDEWEKNMENTCLILFDVVSRNICLKAPLHIPYHTIMYHLFTVLVFLRGSYRAWHGSCEIAHQRDHNYIMLLEYPFGLRSPRVAKKPAQCSSNSYPRIDTPQNIWNKQIIITKDEGGNLKTAQLPIQRHLRLLFISQDHLLHREGAASIQIHAVAKQSELDHISFPLQFLLPHLAVTPRGIVKIHPVI